MEIKPTYVTFEQAKLLKVKGVDIDTLYFYADESWKQFNEIRNTIEVGEGYSWKNIDRQAWGEVTPAYEQWQVVEWLSDVKKIDVSVRRMPSGTFAYQIATFNGDATGWKIGASVFNFLTRKEAYSSAFDYILKELI